MKNAAPQKKPQPTEIVKQEKAELPEHLRRAPGEAAAGFEFMGGQDMTLPRLGLAQALSPQLSERDPSYIDGLKTGEFFNTITRENFGKSVAVVPLLFYKSRLRFLPQNEGGGLVCRADDGKFGLGDPGGECLRCPLARFGPDGSRPQCMEMFNFASLVCRNGTVEPDGLIVVSLKSTGLRIAKDWNAQMRLRRTDMFAAPYELESVEMSNAQKQRWFVPKVTPVVDGAGYPAWLTKEMYINAKLAYQAVSELQKEGRLRHDIRDMGGEREPGEEQPF